MRRVPVIPTIVVLLAVAIMIALGFWQLHRLGEKEALLAHYAAARSNSKVVNWTAGGVDEDLLYRRAQIACDRISQPSSMAGRNASGASGIAHTAKCHMAGGGEALVVLGWSVNPMAKVAWQGGVLTGVIAPGPRLVAQPPVAGLEANALPDPADIPNNHLSYAVQWFLFAVTAMVIYGLALRRRR